MLRLLMVLNLVFTCSANEIIEETKPTLSSKDNENNILSQEIKDFIEEKNIEYALESIERIAATAKKSRKEGILPTEHVENRYEEIVDTLKDLIELLQEQQNTYKFLNIKGVDRVITPIIGINFEPLKKQLLILIKTLFKVAPTTTNAVIPINVIDKLLDIFENDDNLALKTYALDVMYLWLPNNPKIQARVMKLKGLEPFYDQITKLDANAINTLLDLFNKILQEHVKARDDKALKNKDDFARMKRYEKIGLLERMSTTTVCNGILNVFEAILPFDDDDEQFLTTVFDLVKNIKPFCLNVYKKQPRSKKAFNVLKKYLIDPDKRDFFKSLDFNITDAKMVIEDYVIKINDNIKDEF